MFEGGKATGTMAMGGDPKPVSVDLGGELFADGAGGQDAIGALPLAEGYSTTFRNFDVRQQKVQLKQAKVAGSEKVTVPAGTFETWKVEIVSADGEPGSTTNLGREGPPQGRQDHHDASADGWRRGDDRAAAVGSRLALGVLRTPQAPGFGGASHPSGPSD